MSGYFKKRDYNTENIDKFKEFLQRLSWASVYNENNFSTAFSCFYEDFKLLYYLCFPIKKIRAKSQTKCSRNWFTKGIKKSTKTKRYLRFAYYKNPSDVNKTKFRRYSKFLKRCINQSQKITNSKYLLRSKNICKSTWEVIQNKTVNPLKFNIDRLIVNNEVVSNPTYIANSFNNSYIRMTNVNNDNTKFKNPRINSNNASLFLTPTDDHEIIKIIKSLKSTNSVGYDEIQTRILKACRNEIAPVLSYLVNLSFSNGVFPEPLKVSIVRPLYKKGARDIVDNYRPIALIPTISKIFEKVMLERITKFLDKYKIIKPNQYGFQKGKSTSLAAFSLVNKILDYMDKRRSVTTVFFDMTKAFDFVAHDILLTKCDILGLRGIVNEWIKSYLNNRTQYVEISKLDKNNELIRYKSSIKLNKVGVPQGSILGPLLFLLYINDLPDVTENDCVLFADDVSVIVPCGDISNYNDAINKTVFKIISWLKNNNLNVNLTKTTYVQFVNRNAKKRNLKITFNNKLITESSQTVFLGITLDDKVSWADHINKICSKINSFVYALWRLTKISNRKVAIQAYHGYVGSILRYAILLWGNSCHVNRAFIAQKQCLRAICNVDSLTSCRPLFPALKILTVACMYIYELCVFVKSNPNLFIKRCESHNTVTRYPNRLLLHASTTQLYGRNSYQMAIKVYNRLNDDMKSLSLEKFKLKLKNWLLEKSFYSLNEYFESFKL